MKCVQPVFVVVMVSVVASCASSPKTKSMSFEEGAKTECRSIQEFGSILPKRVCNNKATWAAIDERNRELAKEFKDAVDRRYTPIEKDPGM